MWKQAHTFIPVRSGEEARQVWKNWQGNVTSCSRMNTQRNVCMSGAHSSRLYQVLHRHRIACVIWAPLLCCWHKTGAAEGQVTESQECLKVVAGGARCRGHWRGRRRGFFFPLRTSFNCITWCSRARFALRPPNRGFFQLQWSKGAGEGKCGEVRKPRQRPRSSKGALMDLEIQVGDMKEEQVPRQSFEVLSLYKSEFQYEGRIRCVHVCMWLYMQVQKLTLPIMQYV